VRAPLVEAKQDRSIRIQDLTKVVMVRRRLRLTKERLVPFEAARNVAYADDRPCAFHRICAVGLTVELMRRREFKEPLMLFQQCQQYKIQLYPGACVTEVGFVEIVVFEALLL
jgi:hypothetical protein